MVRHLNGWQKIIILGTSILLLISVLYPPWIRVLDRRDSIPLHYFLGYKFILKPPDEFNVSIDFSRLVLQTVAILFFGVIVFCVFTWLKATNANKPNKQSSPRDKIEMAAPPSVSSKTSHFKSREEYERWKDEKLQLLSKRNRSDFQSPSPPKFSTRWLSFYTFVYLPFGFLTSFVLILAEYDKLVERGYVVTFNPLGLVPIITEGIFRCFIIYGLHKRRLWAWICNWFLLCSTVLINPIFYARDIGPYLVAVVLLGIVFFLPNFFYFKKRRVLFS